tara:strand:- start:99 stop:929 length:831 start_codon:yes stop_codon:yes gene_type:complete
MSDECIGDISASFLPDDEVSLGNQYLNDGFVVAPVADLAAFERITSFMAGAVAEMLDEKYSDAESFLNSIHRLVKSESLNSFRLALIQRMNAATWFRAAYFRLARPTLEQLVGNELAMQLRVNLSIQTPGDDQSLLPVHADVWSGDSPYEVVVWLPLVHCFGTKAMYILPPLADKELRSDFQKYASKTSDELFERIQASVVWIEIKPGEVLFFNQNLPHGNRVNEENETRWSMNCRFKSVFSPYGDKKLGEFFEPVTLKPASRVGMSYRFPSLGAD